LSLIKFKSHAFVLGTWLIVNTVEMEMVVSGLTCWDERCL
jgi:hypothetical protein